MSNVVILFLKKPRLSTLTLKNLLKGACYEQVSLGPCFYLISLFLIEKCTVFNLRGLNY